MTSSGKVRIYELSRDLGLDNKDVLDAAEKLSIAARSHSSSISDDEAIRIKALIQGHGSATPQPAAKTILSVKKADVPPPAEAVGARPSSPPAGPVASPRPPQPVRPAAATSPAPTRPMATGAPPRPPEPNRPVVIAQSPAPARTEVKLLALGDKDGALALNQASVPLVPPSGSGHHHQQSGHGQGQ